MGYMLGDRTQPLDPLRHRLGQLVREWRTQPDLTIGSLRELDFAERGFDGLWGTLADHQRKSLIHPRRGRRHVDDGGRGMTAG